MIDYWGGSQFPPRDWQFEALPKIIECLKKGQRPIVSATMGAGKSVLIAELCWVAMHKVKPNQKIIIAAPRQHLVEQLADTVGKRVGDENVGLFYTHCKQVGPPVIVTCFASMKNLSYRLDDSRCVMLIGDEVHGTESDMFKESFQRIDPSCAVGFTATPFRSEAKKTLTLWDSVAYRYTAKDALKDGVIVPWKLVHWDGSKFHKKEVDEICIDLIIKHGKGPGIVNATSIKDAEDFAGLLRSRGLLAECVHSGLDRLEQKLCIDRLRLGCFDILVHVNMLSEGVDFPFLRWLCMRRPVGAKVRFVQEVGRVLRSHRGKDEAIIMDPFDLFSKHGLTYPEQIGQLLEKDPDIELLAKLDLENDEEIVEEFKSMRPAVAINNCESWITGIISTMRVHGLAKPPNPDYDRLRTEPPTQRQMKTLGRLKWSTRYLPKSHREDFKTFFEGDRILRLSQGAVSDMLDICFSLAALSGPMRKVHRHWSFPESVKLPETKIPIQGLLFISNR